MPPPTIRSLSSRPFRLVALAVVPVFVLAACTGDSAPSSPPTSPAPQPSGPIAAAVSSCTKPFSQGQTKLVVSFRLHGADVPLHFKNAAHGAAFMGASPAPLSAGTATPEPGTGRDVLTMTGPLFDHITFEHAQLVAEGSRAVRAPSLAALEGKRFPGPFGDARIVKVSSKGSHVVVKVGSRTLTSGPSGAGPKGSDYVNDLGFTGKPPMDGPATLTLSSWTLLDLDPLTVVVPATCQAG